MTRHAATAIVADIADHSGLSRRDRRMQRTSSEYRRVASQPRLIATAPDGYALAEHVLALDPTVSRASRAENGKQSRHPARRPIDGELLEPVGECWFRFMRQVGEWQRVWHKTCLFQKRSQFVEGKDGCHQRDCARLSKRRKTHEFGTLRGA